MATNWVVLRVETDRLRTGVEVDKHTDNTFVDASVEGGSQASDDESTGESGEDADATDGEKGNGFEQLPLDGGTYTWTNGVTMSLSVDRTEPWGDVDDFCGDGSCGVANRDDTRVVIRYEVTVPDDVPEPFDAYACPGDLSVMSGNSDEALSGVPGDYDREIDGKIFPGQSKFGLAEYYIEKDYAGGEFFNESSRGDESDERAPTSSATSANASAFSNFALAILTVFPAPLCCQPVVWGVLDPVAFREDRSGCSVTFAGPGSG